MLINLYKKKAVWNVSANKKHIKIDTEALLAKWKHFQTRPNAVLDIKIKKKKRKKNSYKPEVGVGWLR